MRFCRLFVVALALLLVPPAYADEAPKLYENGMRVPLEDGLTTRTGDGVWIRRKDLVNALGIVVRELIPPLADPFGRDRKKQKPAPQVFILCQHGRCARMTKKDVDAGFTDNEAFRLSAVAKALGWTIEPRDDGLDLIPKDGTAKRGFKLGDRMPALALPDLQGKPRSLDALRGSRVLVVRWASWSPSRETLDTWAAEWKLRKDRGLELVLIALDLEGRERAERYVPPGVDDKVRIDRSGVTARIGGSLDTGRFLLLDEFGTVRAVGGRPTTDNIAWIDRHLAEAIEDTTPTTVAPEPVAVTEADLRARIEKRPKDQVARLALARRLDAAGDATGARAVLEAGFEAGRKSGAASAFLARLMLDAGDSAAAMNILDAARRAQPKDMWLRKQRWALLHPARFYAGDIDVAWLAKTLKEEDIEIGRRRRKRR